MQVTADNAPTTTAVTDADGVEKRNEVVNVKAERSFDPEHPSTNMVMPSVRSTLEWIRQQARARPTCRTQVKYQALAEIYMRLCYDKYTLKTCMLQTLFI